MGPTPPGTTDRRSLNRVFDALADHHRRRILLAVAEGHDDLSTASLVERVVDESGDPKELRLKLYHCHLPKLTSAGYVEWNRDSGDLRPGRNFDEVDPVLRTLADNREDIPGSWP